MREEDFEQAELYCRNLLDESAKRQVETRASGDETFRQLLKDTKNVLAGIQAVGREELREKLKMWETEHPAIKSKKERVISLRSWLSIGMAASLVVAAGLFYWWPEKATDTLALFQAYYKPYPNVVMPLVRSAENDSSIAASAYGAYERGEYEIALDYLAKLPDSLCSVSFYQGQCYLAMEQPEPAIASFIKCLEMSGGFETQAEWYLALAYLQNGDQKNAKKALDKVAARQSTFSSDAGALLKHL